MTNSNCETQDQQASVSSVLKRLLAHTNLSTNFLAKEINLPTPTVHRIVTGEVQDPRISTLISIANYFDITIDQLLGNVALNDKFGEQGEIPKPPASIPVLTITEATEYEKYLNTSIDWLRWQTQNKNSNYQIPINTFSVLIKNSIYDPPFLSGTYLIVNPKEEPASGDYVLVKFKNDPNAVIKKYISEGHQKYLYPLRSDLKSVPFDQDDCSLIGVIIETYLKLKY